MGSGLILLLIVGAWLAVLVPMALRSHEASALATVDKFSDAMRVLSRRDAVGRPDAAEASPGSDEPLEEPDGRSSVGRLGRTRARLRRLLRLPRWHARRPSGRRPLTPARRRLRTLLVLLSLTALTLVGAVVGPLWLLAPHLVVDAVLVVFLCWLRASAAARAEREWRLALGDRRSESDHGPILPVEIPEQVAPVGPARVAGIPDRLPSRTALDPRPERLLPAPRTAEAPARGAQGQPWEPVPVPVPTYVTAPRAPRRRDAPLSRSLPPVTGGLVRAGDSGRELDHVLGRRRAVGD